MTARASVSGAANVDRVGVGTSVDDVDAIASGEVVGACSAAQV